MLYLGIIEKREKIKVMKRIRIEDQINLDTFKMFDNVSFEEISKTLIEEKEKLEQQGWTDPKIKIQLSYDGAELLVYGMRLENDEEFEIRIAKEELKAKKARKKEERERKLYEELKTKFEK